MQHKNKHEHFASHAKPISQQLFLPYHDFHLKTPNSYSPDYLTRQSGTGTTANRREVPI